MRRAWPTWRLPQPSTCRGRSAVWRTCSACAAPATSPSGSGACAGSSGLRAGFRGMEGGAGETGAGHGDIRHNFCPSERASPKASHMCLPTSPSPTAAAAWRRRLDDVIMGGQSESGLASAEDGSGAVWTGARHAGLRALLWHHSARCRSARPSGSIKQQTQLSRASHAGHPSVAFQGRARAGSSVPAV